MPIINAFNLLPFLYLELACKGVGRTDVVRIDTDTGLLRQYKQPFQFDVNKVIAEEVCLDLDKLHVYLVKPKLST